MIELAKRIERTALDRDERVTGVEEVVYVDEDGSVAIACSRARGELCGLDRLPYLQAMAAGDGEVQTGLGFGVGRSPDGLDPEAIGRRGRPSEASSMLGASKPRSRSCPVVLSERVAASFAGFIGGALCADEVQRGRSPFADRLGDELASPALALADDGSIPAASPAPPLTARASRAAVPR